MHFSSLAGLCRAASLAAALAFGTCTVQAQDLLARQAPIDRRLRAVDSITIQRLTAQPTVDLATASAIYNQAWDTGRAHPYSREQQSNLPDSLCIDLTGFAMPTTSRQVTSRFGYRPRFRRQHKGLDIKVYTGDTIYAAFDGKVRVTRYDAGGYGNYIVVRHPNGLETIYGHLSKQLVETNQEVKAGEPIGLGGNTGRSFGSHLHFETRVLGEAIDPALLFDFAAQDVTCNVFTYHREGGDRVERTANRIMAENEAAANGNERVLASAEQSAGSQHDNADAATAGGVAGRNAATVAETAGNTRAAHFYKVRTRETLAEVAHKLGISPQRLAKANSLGTSAKLRTGQILRY